MEVESAAAGEVTVDSRAAHAVTGASRDADASEYTTAAVSEASAAFGVDSGALEKLLLMLPLQLALQTMLLMLLVLLVLPLVRLVSKGFNTY